MKLLLVSAVIAALAVPCHAQPVLVVGGTHFPAASGMVCDGNNDGKVAIDELIQGVNNALDPLAHCGFGCEGPCWRPIATDPPCPCDSYAQCVEPGVTEGLRCGTSLCYRNDAQVDRCVRALAEAHPELCEVTP